MSRTQNESSNQRSEDNQKSVDQPCIVSKAEHYKSEEINQQFQVSDSKEQLLNSEINKQITLTIGASNQTQNKSSWLHNVLNCISPIFSSIKFGIKSQQQATNDWIIKFSSITNLEYVNAGAQGSVYRGKLNGHEIAVKKVRTEQDIKIDHLRKLKHNNIVRFIGVCIEPYCILMEFCAYGNLSHYLLEHKNDLQPDLIWEFAFQITSGMNYLNYNSIIHRDLKGLNILLCSDNQLKICDFDMSKKHEALADQNTLVGTCSHIAPEVIKNANYDEKIDVWSFGVVIWELMTCEIAYEGIDSPRIMFGVYHNRFKLPISVDCPEGFKLLMEMCFSRRPIDRPSFSKILLHLQNICKDQMYQMSLEKFNEIKTKWRTEIKSTFESFKGFEINDESPSSEQNLANQRNYLESTIKLSQDVFEMYKKKLSQVNELCSEMDSLLETVVKRQKELNQLLAKQDNNNNDN